MKVQTLVTGNKISFQKAISVDNWFREDCSNSILGICINSMSVQLTVYQIKEDCFQFFESYSAQNINDSSLDEFFSQLELTKVPFQSITVCFSDLSFTLIPESLYDNKIAVEYLKFTHNSVQNNYVFHEKPGNEVVMVCGINQEIHNTIQKHFPTSVYSFKNNVLVDHFLKKVMDKECMIMLNDDIVQIVVGENSRLIYYNSFRFRSTEDLLYYVMMAYDQFGLNSAKSILNINGGVDADSNVFKALNKYISKISFFPADLSFNTSQGFGEIPQHYTSAFFYNIYENYRRKIQG